MRYIYVASAAAAKSFQSCPTLCDPIDGSPPGSPVPGILQARTLCIYTLHVYMFRSDQSLSRVRLFVTPWIAARQASLSIIYVSWIISFIKLPWWLSGKKSACQCRWAFDPQVGKIPWRRIWQPTPVFLPRTYHGQRSLMGYNLWGYKELDLTE